MTIGFRILVGLWHAFLWCNVGYSSPCSDSTSSKVSNILRCEKLCQRNANCISFGFNIRTKECVLKDSTTLTTNDGIWRFKNIQQVATQHCATGELSIPGKGGSYTCVPPKCPFALGYTLNETVCICYKVIHGDGDGPTQQEFCKSEGGHLLYIKDATVQQWIIDELDQPEHGTTSRYCIDATWSGSQWTQYNGDPIQYTNWAPGEPNGLASLTANCTEMRGDMSYGYTWNDFPCYGFGRKVGSICQVDI